LQGARDSGVAGSAASAGLVESHWLCPIEDRRRLDSSREGMLEGFSLRNYLLLVDYTSRLFREGKAAIARDVAEIFARLGTTAETWQTRLEKLSKGRLLGRFSPSASLRLRGQPAAAEKSRQSPAWRAHLLSESACAHSRRSHSRSMSQKPLFSLYLNGR
jgi:hypothetical protein